MQEEGVGDKQKKHYTKQRRKCIMKKMNNKGFSLVELIVVVLIMAIIAVALAPQVMKWVENSRLSTDAETYDGLIANIQVALTDKEAYAEQKSLTTTVFTINNTDTQVTSGNPKLVAALGVVNPGWNTAKSKVSGATYKIYLVGDGTTINVKRGSGTEAPNTSSNKDLS
jgi:prepilin-type N-terminal cleavage/methylation domain-containing protein